MREAFFKLKIKDMVLKLITVFSALSFYFSSCTKFTYEAITLKNNSNKNILYSITSTAYPDTSIPSETYLGSAMSIRPFENQIIMTIRSTRSPKDPIQLFLYDSSIVKSTSWDTMVKNYLILKRYDLTIDSIRKNGYVIIYP